MPEGDSVLQAARRLDAALAGQVLTHCDLRVPRFATADLTGREVLDVTARGKHLLTRVQGGLTLHSHLGMEGSWRVFGTGDRWTGGPGHQIRAVLGNEVRTAVGYRLPVLELVRTASEESVVGHLGPDLLGPDWDPVRALESVTREPGRPLGEALLDQRNLAGIGNIYKSEICFVLRATPWLPVGELPPGTAAQLPDIAKKLLEANRDSPMRVTTGRWDQRHYVYGRAPRPCLRCGTSVRVADQGEPGRERPTYWCPSCQQGPAPDPAPRTARAPGNGNRTGTRGAAPDGYGRRGPGGPR